MSEQTWPIFICKEDSPAFGLLKRMSGQGVESGAIFTASKEEMVAFAKDVIIINGTKE